MNEWKTPMNGAPRTPEAVPDGQQPVPPPPDAVPYSQQPAPAGSPELPGQENVTLGVVGAFLGAIAAAALYVGIYQLGIIAGIVGWVAVALADLGYKKCSGVKNSMKGVVIAIVMAVIAIFLGEYICVSIEVYRALSGEWGITFFDAVRITPSFMFDPEIVLYDVLKDLAIAYALGALASFTTVRQAIAANKKRPA